MSLLNSVLKVFVGDKRKKDLKELQPLIDNVRAFDAQMAALTLDELRNKTVEFKDKIQLATSESNQSIAALNEEIETAHIDRKEEIYKEIDDLNDEIYTISENVLKEIMPEAFAVVKETAKRFVENSTQARREAPVFSGTLLAVPQSAWPFFRLW